MSDDKQLTVIEQREIGFYEDQVIAVKVEGGTVYVPIRPICELIGVAWQPQARKLNSDPILSDVSMSITIRLQTSDSTSRRPQTSDMLCLPLEYLNGWLFGINSNRVKEEIRPKLLQYQRDVYHILYEAFGRNEVTAAPNPLIDDLIDSDDPTAVAYRQALAIVNMAREQLIIKARLETSVSRIDDHENRLQIIKADRGDDSRYITNSQAVQIAQAVKQIALELGRRSKRNEFGGVYGELHRQFDVPGYKMLPAPKFDEAMNFLRQWWEGLTDDTNVPFVRPEWSEMVSVIGGGHEQHPVIAAEFPPN